MARIEDALPFVLSNEGGSKYTNVPGDAGGPTKYGITLATLAGWRHHPVTAEDVKNLTYAEATAIFKAHFWDAMALDMVKSQPVATALFDCAVNRGVGVSIRYRDEVVGTLGYKHLNDVPPPAFMQAFERKCEAGYRAIVASRPSQVKFLKGWLNRAKRMLGLLK